MYQERNNMEWFIIDVLDLDENYLERVTIRIGVVSENCCAHNKCFLFPEK